MDVRTDQPQKSFKFNKNDNIHKNEVQNFKKSDDQTNIPCKNIFKNVKNQRV